MNAELAQGKPAQGILRQPTTRDLILLAVSGTKATAPVIRPRYRAGCFTDAGPFV